MLQRATRMGFAGRLVNPGEDFEYPTKMNWADSLEPEKKPEPVDKTEPEKKPEPKVHDKK